MILVYVQPTKYNLQINISHHVSSDHIKSVGLVKPKADIKM